MYITRAATLQLRPQPQIRCRASSRFGVYYTACTHGPPFFVFIALHHKDRLLLLHILKVLRASQLINSYISGMDPLSAFGLACEIGSLVKGLYDYGSMVRSAQRDIIAICGELTALKSALELFPQYGENDVDMSHDSDFRKMLESTQTLLNELAQSTAPKSTISGRVLQSITWPLNSAAVNGKLIRLERLKTWFIMAFTLENRMDSKRLADTMQELLRLVQQQRDGDQQRQEKDIDRQLLALIAPESPYAAHQNNCRPWQGTPTGAWFLQGALEAWLENTSSKDRLMVLTGRSGSGKTTLMSRAIEEAKQFSEQHSDVYVAYFYCAYNNISSRQTRNILGSCVEQVATRRREVLNDFPRDARGLVDITISKLEDCLTNFDSKGRLLLLIDAVNESVDGEELLDSLQHILHNSTRMQVLLSITPSYRGTHEALKDASNTVTMLPQYVNQDITIYLHDQILKHRVLSRVPAEEIVQALLPQSEGMFRWVDCQMSFLTSQLTPNAARKALKALPGTLDGTYELMLERVPHACQALVKEILTWLSFCQRPFQLDELCEAAILDADQTDIDEGDQIDNPEELLAMCQGLAELDPVTGAVTLAHSSVKAFLTGDYIRSSRVSQFALDDQMCSLELTRKCLIYLMMDPFRRGVHTRVGDRERRAFLSKMLEKYALLDYVCLHWATHARSCKLTPRETTLIERFFKTQKLSGGGNFALWISCLSPSYPIGALHETQPLYYAASYGLTSIVNLLLESGLVSKNPAESEWHIDHPGGRNMSSALQVAVWRGHADIVDLLLDAGADPNSVAKGSGMSCMTAALLWDHYEIAEKLLKAGASPEIQKSKNRYRRKREQHGANEPQRAVKSDS